MVQRSKNTLYDIDQISLTCKNLLLQATAKLPTKADLSNCHLEFLPETVFINDELEILNLRHNVLKERPIEEDIYTIGWLDDLPR
jgi:PH domain/leucine-rich repeat-containing protein phosphatase